MNRRSWLIALLALAVLLVAGGIGLALYLSTPQTIQDPFSAKTLASADFPIYYPAQAPAGFHIDQRSVTQPQSGVVVLTLSDGRGQKIYMSQEARPSTFNFGGYYQSFTDQKETVTSNGTIAVGRINNNRTEVGSLATTKTWVVVNTDAAVPLDQLTALLENLAASH